MWRLAVRALSDERLVTALSGPCLVVGPEGAFLLLRALQEMERRLRRDGVGVSGEVRRLREALEPAALAWVESVGGSAGGSAEVPQRPESSEWVESMTVEEVAQVLGTSTRYVRSLAMSEALPARKVGRSWTFDQLDVLAFAGARQDRNSA
ncbi:excisionase family DNA binding protein [Motilibacter peucedani]|uniref:Excisionase family DNA binding protein n=1 Tax=Motilibacter peucedani TaxID=598650 RepID=A0A420XRR6_9ACTN|nr:helix-turn-helix domain-containing protein [Motilibacter peucedani]RKS77593.1 excisionase family DNA binding protein [Motilibacter peucedani]